MSSPYWNILEQKFQKIIVFCSTPLHFSTHFFPFHENCQALWQSTGVPQILFLGQLYKLSNLFSGWKRRWQSRCAFTKKKKKRLYYTKQICRVGKALNIQEMETKRTVYINFFHSFPKVYEMPTVWTVATQTIVYIVSCVGWTSDVWDFTRRKMSSLKADCWYKASQQAEARGDAEGKSWTGDTQKQFCIQHSQCLIIMDIVRSAKRHI